MFFSTSCFTAVGGISSPGLDVSDVVAVVLPVSVVASGAGDAGAVSVDVSAVVSAIFSLVSTEYSSSLPLNLIIISALIGSLLVLKVIVPPLTLLYPKLTTS